MGEQQPPLSNEAFSGQPCLLKLPGEVRNLVYNYAMSPFPQSLALHQMCARPRNGGPTWAALTRVWRQLRTETLPLYATTGLHAKIALSDANDYLDTFIMQTKPRPSHVPMPVYSIILKCVRLIVHMNLNTCAALRTEILPLISLRKPAPDIELEVLLENLSTPDFRSRTSVYWVLTQDEPRLKYVHASVPVFREFWGHTSVLEVFVTFDTEGVVALEVALKPEHADLLIKLRRWCDTKTVL